MIYEWSPSGEHPFMKTGQGLGRNFGDALIDVLVSDVDKRNEFYSDEKNVWFLVGSVICNEVIQEVVGAGYRPIFVRCGWRGEEIEYWNAMKATFMGVRGYGTQAALKRAGVETTVECDPGYDIPGIIPKTKASGHSVLIPHVNDELRLLYSPRAIGVDFISQPLVLTRKNIVGLIEYISGARFVLTGSLHAAIIAHAYGVPFGLFSGEGGGYVDCPAKWEDWAGSVGITDVRFFDNVMDARLWHSKNVPVFSGHDGT